jgi:hypothetical protein
VLDTPEYRNKIFSVKEYPFEECFRLGQQIIKEYTVLPSTELWNFETFNSTLNQLEYYRSAGLFSSDEDFKIVIDSFNRLIDHLQEQANAGFKYMPGMSETGHKAPFKFFINEILLGNNTFYLNLDGKPLSIITYNALNYLITRDIRFGKKMSQGFNTLISRSTLISGTGEKERNKFFRIQREKILQLKK